MFASRFLLLALALLFAVVEAQSHGQARRARRGTCPRRLTSSSAVSSAVPVSSGFISVPVTTRSTSTTAQAPSPSSSLTRVSSTQSSSKASSTQSSTKAASSSTPKATSSAKPSSSTVKASSTVKSSSSTAAPSPTGAIPGLLGKVFPVEGYGNRAWSTTNVLGNALPLSDATFRPNNVLRSVPHSYTSAPDGKYAMRAFYPKGSYTFGNNPQGGFSFYAPGSSSLDLTTAKEATFSYSVYFPKGFAFNLGGKLPGLYGGNSAGEAVGCSGGSRSSACFSARLMWRADGEGEFYTYLPPHTDSRFGANSKLCTLPYSYCHPTYGTSIGRGAFTFATGAWTTVSERVRLNDVGQANGELQLFVNGKSVLDVSGLILRDSSAGRIRGMQMQTFFGGSQPQFATPKDQEVFFSDFSIAITKTL